MMIVQQVTPDPMQGRVNSLVFAGLQGGPRLGDAEAGLAAAVAGPQFAAWSGGLLSVATAIVTCWAIPQFWRYRSDGGVAPAHQPEAPAHQPEAPAHEAPAEQPEPPAPAAGEPAGRAASAAEAEPGPGPAS
jgi:hypothetical protein